MSSTSFPLILGALAALTTGVATAWTPAPTFVAYSGEIKSTTLTGTATVPSNMQVYLVADVADLGTFSMIFVDETSHACSIISRSDQPGSSSSNPDVDHLRVIGTGANASGFLSYSSWQYLSQTGSTVYGYGTGTAATGTTVLVPARLAPLTVNLTVNGTARGTYTFPASAAITNGGAPYPLVIHGTSFAYVTNTVPALTSATLPGQLMLKEDPALTALVNLGGGWTVNRANTAVLLPAFLPYIYVGSEATYLADWLGAFAQVNGWTPVSGATVPPANPTVLMGIASNGNNGTISGTGSFTFGPGTLALLPGQSVNATTLAVLGNLFSEAYSLGGLTAVPATSEALVTETGTTNPAVAFSLPVSNQEWIQAFTMPFGALGFGPLPVTVTLRSATLTISSINKGVVAGTISEPDINGVFQNATFSVNGVTDLSTFSPGQTFTGQVSLGNPTLYPGGVGIIVILAGTPVVNTASVVSGAGTITIGGGTIGTGGGPIGIGGFNFFSSFTDFGGTVSVTTP